jgi:3-oxoadipate enol-lactonase
MSDTAFTLVNEQREQAVNDSGFIEVDGGRIYYEVDGSGSPLTLIHAGVANLRQWDPQLPAFAERHTVIRYDTRGFGRTTTANVAFSNRADLMAVLDHLGIERTHLLGTSRGGQIALDATLEFAERIRSLTVVAGGVGGYEAPSTPEEAAVWDEMMRREEARDWEYLIEAETAVWVDGPGQAADRVSPALRQTVHDWIADSYRDHADEEPEPQPLEPPANGRLGEIAVPVLVIVGTFDSSSTVQTSRYLAQEVPDARLELFDGVAHMVNLEQPDRFRDVVLAFLEDVERPG